MNKEQKYTSLELSKKIYALAKKKGIELPESEYCWRDSKRFGVELVSVEEFRTLDGSRIKLVSEKGLYKGYFAYDTAEWGELLKNREEQFADAFPCWDKGTWTNSHLSDEIRTEAEARGQMYFYLLNNNLL